MDLTLEQYTDKSVALFGDSTRQLTPYLKEYGGRFNRNLRGRPGWIFSAQRTLELQEFVGRVQAGQIPLQPVATQTPAARRVTPPTGVLPVMRFPKSPMLHAATPVKGIQVTQRPVAAPMTAAQVELPIRMPIAQQTGVQINYPATFRAADNVNYQILVYTVPLPYVGQRLVVTVGEEEIPYEVIELDNGNFPVTSLLVRADDAREDEVSRMVLVGGEFQIWGFEDQHNVKFEA